MGYDLHITRAKRWVDAATHPISDAEWRARVDADPEFEVTGVAEVSAGLQYENRGLVVWHAHPSGDSVWFDLRDGRVVVKNPDAATIAKMISLARSLHARVEGDDGEQYEVPGRPPRSATISLRDRVASWLERLRPPPRIEAPVLPFDVGDRVRNIIGQEATVVAIDLKAEHGLGRVHVRFDDGRELSFAAVAHGLTPTVKEHVR